MHPFLHALLLLNYCKIMRLGAGFKQHVFIVTHSWALKGSFLGIIVKRMLETENSSLLQKSPILEA